MDRIHVVRKVNEKHVKVFFRENKTGKRLIFTNTCKYCNEAFMSNKKTAKYCCDSHRILAFLDRKKLLKESGWDM